MACCCVHAKDLKRKNILSPFLETFLFFCHNPLFVNVALFLTSPPLPELYLFLLSLSPSRKLKWHVP